MCSVVGGGGVDREKNRSVSAFHGRRLLLAGGRAAGGAASARQGALLRGRSRSFF